MTDPLSLRGSIAGPGGPRDRNAVVVDATEAVLLDDITVCAVEPHRAGVPQPACVALTLAGRINHRPERAELLFLFDLDGAAAIVTELVGLAMRMGAGEFSGLIRSRLARLAAEDAIGGGLDG